MKRFLLVPSTQIPSPLVNKLSVLDNDIRIILDRNDLGDYEKARLYSDTLEKYLDIKKQLQQPNTIPLIDDSDNTEKMVLNMANFPRQYRSRAENILSHISNESSIKWNKRGEILRDGKIITGSNVIDLINDVIKTSKNEPPIGSKEFIKLLKDSNIPMSLIGHKTRFEDLVHVTPLRPIPESHTPTLSSRPKSRSRISARWETLS